MSKITPIYVAVVDDDENLCGSVGRLLRAAGIQPITYSSAEAFLADTTHPQFDCLVLDIQLGVPHQPGHGPRALRLAGGALLEFGTLLWLDADASVTQRRRECNEQR